MFRFTIRDLVLLTLIVALGVGWWIDRRRMAASLAELDEYKLPEKRDLGRMAAEEKFRDLGRQFLAAKAVNEYGVPKPASQRTAQEQKEVERAGREYMRALEQRLEQEQQRIDAQMKARR